jgi:hypothetical protein
VPAVEIVIFASIMVVACQVNQQQQSSRGVSFILRSDRCDTSVERIRLIRSRPSFRYANVQATPLFVP